MRWINFILPALLGACASAPGQPSPRLSPGEPAAHLNYRDLDLESSSGRAALRERVSTAAQDFCRDHSGDVVPETFSVYRPYCPQIVRATLMDAMPQPVRKAYARALREAGVPQHRF